MPACFITNNSTSATLCSQSTIKMPSIPDQQSVLLLNTTTSPVSPPNLTNNNLNSSALLRRSLSAVDMSLSNSSSFMKKTASSDHLNELNPQESSSSSSSSSSSPPVVSKGAFDDIWKSINQNGKTNSLPPYIHPLSKRWSTSSLSDKSLEICTESLGSETGSDILSPNFSISDDLHVDGSSSAEGEDYEVVETKVTAEEREEEEVVLLPVEMMMMTKQKKEEVLVVQAAFVEDDMKKNVVDVDQPKVVPPPLPSLANRGSTIYTTKKVGGQRSFPPPLPSLANRGTNGSNLHVTMRSHRQDGRLVLEAISVPSPNCCFHAQRLDGRLLLTFSDDDEHIITDPAANHCQQLCKGVFNDENENQICYENELEDDDENNVGRRNKRVSLMPPQKNDNHHQSDVSGKIQNTHRGVGGLINYPGHKFMGLTKTTSGQHSQSHRQKLNKAINDSNTTTTTVKDEVAKSPLPPRPPSATSRLIPTAQSAAAASFNYNAYEYYWRSSPTTTTTTIQSTYLHTSPPPAATTTTTTGAGGGKRVPPPTLSPKTVRGINDMFVELATAQQQAHRNYNNNTKFMIVKPTTDTPPTKLLTEKSADHDKFMNNRHSHHHQLPPLPPPFVTGCRLSLLMWEPHCIATS